MEELPSTGLQTREQQPAVPKPCEIVDLIRRSGAGRETVT